MILLDFIIKPFLKREKKVVLIEELTAPINTHKNLLVLQHFRNHLHSKNKKLINERVHGDL